MTKLVLSAMLALITINIIMSGCDNGTDEVLAPEPEEISAEELKSLLDNRSDMVLVDVRSRDSYDAGHIPGAISMPFPDEIRARYQELPLDKTIILY